MKKKMIITAVIISLLFVTASFAMTFTRDIVDHVEIDKAVKAEFCKIENPECEETTIGGLNANQAADCLRQRIAELDCQEETKEIIYGEMRIYTKEGGEATDTIIIVDEEIYDGSTGMFGYYYINDDFHQGVDTSAGGYYAYKADSDEKFGGLKYLILANIRRLDSDISPHGYEWVDPGYVLVYYDRDGTLNMYVHLNEGYYRMTSIKKEVENEEWTPPPEPEIPEREVRTPEEIENETGIDIPEKGEIEVPIPPPPVYLPGMPDTADPKKEKEHVIPNCKSQGASICRVNETCPDNKWILAKEEKCCSVVCTPVGGGEAPPGLEKKNRTIDNITDITENETEKPEENITTGNETTS